MPPGSVLEDPTVSASPGVRERGVTGLVMGGGVGGAGTPVTTSTAVASTARATPLRAKRFCAIVGEAMLELRAAAWAAASLAEAAVMVAVMCTEAAATVICTAASCTPDDVATTEAMASSRAGV